jgi:butyryl-CoA dehydrogenase
MQSDQTPEQLLPREIEDFRAELREFLVKEIAPTASIFDREERFPEENIRKFAARGYLGIPVPRKYGGMGLGEMGYGIAVQEISRVDTAHGTIIGASTGLCEVPLWLFGTEDQRQKYLPDMTSGKKLGAFALTEPQAGSDAANIRTTATSEGDHFLINGTKQFITNGDRAQTLIVFAANDLALGPYGGISAFIVDRSFGGVRTAKVEKKMGIRASTTAQIVFENCPVPRDNVLGMFGAGFIVALTALDGGRASLAAGSVGGAQEALRQILEWAEKNPARASDQSIQKMTADMAIEIHAAENVSRQSLEEISYYFDQLAAGQKIPSLERAKISRHAAMAKAYCSEVASSSLDKAIQILGFDAYVEGSWTERAFRDAIISEIYEGTNDIQKLVIARELLGVKEH